MSAKSMSPSAAALRSSRLFSLPSPISRPDGAFAGGPGAIRISETATQPYPTQQAVTTPPTSLARGDWGLKRSLPLRSTTKTSTPLLKIHAVDTREHITDYDSASDLSRTLDKFKELGLPVSVPIGKNMRNAFEPDQDHTDPEAPSQDALTNRTVGRWKHEGQPLELMTEDAFSAYLDKVLREKKGSFLDFLRAKAMIRLKQKRISDRRHSGSGNKQDIDPADMTEDAFNDYIRELRNPQQSFSASSELASLVNEFLDLPGSRLEQELFTKASIMLKARPLTHPSGGLGYLRTDAILQNDAVFGPRARPTPQQARIVERTGKTESERLGVSGFIAEQGSPGTTAARLSRQPAYEITPEQVEEAGDKRAKIQNDMNLKNVGISIPGGNRYWIEPQHVSFDEAGRVHLEVRNASGENVGAHIRKPELSDPQFSGLPFSTPAYSQRPYRTTRPAIAMGKAGNAGNGYGMTDADRASRENDVGAKIVMQMFDVLKQSQGKSGQAND